MDYKVLFLLFSCVFGVSLGFRCYACGFSTVDSDHSCLTITNTTHAVDCPYTHCTIMRQEFIDPPNTIASFLRGCEQRPHNLNTVVEDSNFRTYFRACTNSLCNTGNGIQAVDGGGLSPTPLYTGGNLLVPGTGSLNNAFSTAKVNVLLISAAYFLTTL